MTTTENDTTADGASRLIDSIGEAERTTLESVRKFVDTVDSAFPDLTTDGNGPRQQIIDSAFKMVEQLLGTSNKLAQSVVKVTEDALAGATKDSPEK